MANGQLFIPADVGDRLQAALAVAERIRIELVDAARPTDWIDEILTAMRDPGGAP
jgi:hypothetical protein